MRRLFSHIALFILPVVLLLVLLPVERRAKYTGLVDDCYDHGIWIHDRIFQNAAPVDVVFIGSSHTINAVDDQLLSDSLGQTILNLGYCRLGRNLDHLILEELLSAKKPRVVVVEIREEEDRYSHPIYPFIAPTEDVLTAYPFFCKDVVPDVWTHMAYKAELLQEGLYASADEKKVEEGLYGHGTTPDTASRELLLEKAKERQAKRKVLTGWEANFQYQFPWYHVEQMAELCEENGVELVFLYLPAYDTEVQTPHSEEFYSHLGKVLTPPSDILTDPDLWHDENHLNEAGARRLSVWLSDEFQGRWDVSFVGM